MFHKCCVVSCISRRKDFNFYRFPKSETGLKKWLELINCERLRSMSPRDLSKHFVCQKHFEKRFFASTHVRSRLRVGAYPTLFTDTDISSGVPQNAQPVDMSRQIDVDHNYTRKRIHEDHCYCKREVVEKRPRVEMVLNVNNASTSRQPLHDVSNLGKTIARELDVRPSTSRQPINDLENVAPCRSPSTSGYTNVQSHKMITRARYADGSAVSETLKNTAEIVSFFDDLFDSVNGASMHHKKNRGKPLRHAVTEKSINHTFWKEAVKKIEKIKFIDNRGKETTVPSLTNWVVTLKSLQRLWQFFQTKGIKIMRSRYFNSDPIENFSIEHTTNLKLN